ncbi:MAG TPA: hypothetical protein VFQ70_03665 [Candidatus Saccharimonadaceae bacterium]|nr:hypothetical protein [Candidatus Saccharimonadaceae bacterium]
MSELYHQQRPTDLFPQDSLERTIVEPEIAAAVALAKEYNEILRYVDVSDEELEIIVNQLDGQTRNFFGPMTFSGRMTSICGLDDAPSVHGDDLVTVADAGHIIEKYYDDTPGVFDGFAVHDQPILIDGEQVAVSRQLAFMLQREPSDEEKLVTPGLTSMVGTAELDDVVIEFGIFSVRRAAEWLAYYEPEILSRVDQMIYNASTLEDSMRVMKDMRLWFSHSDERDAEYYEQVCQYVEAYVGYYLAIDRDVPYRMDVDEGEIFLYDDEDTAIESIGKILKQPVVATVLGVKFMPWQSKKGNMFLTPHYDCYIHQPTVRNEPFHVILPAALVNSPRNGREILYAERPVGIEVHEGVTSD